MSAILPAPLTNDKPLNIISGGPCFDINSRSTALKKNDGENKLSITLAYRISINSTLDFGAYTPSVIQAFEQMSDQSSTFVSIWTFIRFTFVILFCNDSSFPHSIKFTRRRTRFGLWNLCIYCHNVCGPGCMVYYPFHLPNSSWIAL